MSNSHLIKVKYVKSVIGYSKRQKETVRSLGLSRLGDEVLQPDNGAVRGMVNAVRHLVSVEMVPEADVAFGEPETGA